MDIQALAKRKTELNITLQAIGMWNTYGKTVDELAEVEMQKINTIKELNEIQARINEYTKAENQ